MAKTRNDKASTFLRYEDVKRRTQNMSALDKYDHGRRQVLERVEVSRLGDSQMGEQFIKELKRIQRVKQHRPEMRRSSGNLPVPSQSVNQSEQ